MMAFDLTKALSSIAPTLATMLGGPLAGAAVTALEGAFGLAPGAGTDGITQVIQGGQMTPDVIAAVRAADQKHAEIMGQQGIDLVKLNADHDAAIFTAEVSDRSSARDASVKGGTQMALFALSLLLLAATIGTEIFALFRGYPATIPEIIVGRVLGLMDAVAMMVLSYWYGTTHGSSEKTQLLAAADPKK